MILLVHLFEKSICVLVVYKCSNALLVCRFEKSICVLVVYKCSKAPDRRAQREVDLCFGCLQVLERARLKGSAMSKKSQSSAFVS